MNVKKVCHEKWKVKVAEVPVVNEKQWLVINDVSGDDYLLNKVFFL